MMPERVSTRPWRASERMATEPERALMTILRMVKIRLTVMAMTPARMTMRWCFWELVLAGVSKLVVAT